MEHTKGPWRVINENKSNAYIVSADNKAITPIYKGIANYEANIKLIISAPELLKAAEYLIDTLADKNGNYREWDSYQQLLKAINKAKGK